jgi:hypothetical protein
MKATITISSKELESLLKEHFTKLGYTPESVAFALREEGYRSGDTYKVFSHASIIVELPPVKE